MDSKILLETGTNELEIAEFGIFLKNGIHQSFGINVAKVREIIKIPSYVSVPEQNSNIMGIFKLREKIVPLINLSGWLHEASDIKDGFVIVTEFNEQNFGFLVHTIKTIHRMSWEKVLPPTKISSNVNADSITGIVPFLDRIVMLLDFEKIVADINPESSLSIMADKAIIANNVSTNKDKVLLAEDSEIVMEMLSSILTEGGFEVIKVKNGKQALEYLETLQLKARSNNMPMSNYVQIVVTDIEMPQMDGHTLCRKIKQSKEYEGLPVVLFSSLIYDEIRRKGELIGADAQISKPEIGNLLNVINGILRKEAK
ncbi:MAG: chemotaxis protein [archaeon]